MLGSHLCTRIWVRIRTGLLKKPLSIGQSVWKKIRNAFPVIRWAPKGLNRNLGASSQTSPTGVKLCLRRRLHVGPLFPGFKCLHVVYHFYSFLTWPAATPSKQFSARWALPGSVRGLARRNKIATDDTVVVPCKKITTIRAVTARVTLTTFKDVAPKKWELFVTQLMFLSRGRQTTLPPKIFIFNRNNRKNVAWI